MSLVSFIENLPSYEDLENKVEELKSEEYYTYSEGTFTASTGDKLVWKRIFWEDGGGNEANVVLFPELKQAVLYGYDHESQFNYYDDQYSEQKVFNDFPEYFKEFLESKTFHWSWDTSQRTWATCGFWSDKNNIWHASEDWAKEIEWDFEDGGVQYTLDRFLN